METTGDTRLPWVQVLRCIAASVVVFHHYTLTFSEHGIQRSWSVHSGLGELGNCGVDLFFVISGFIFVLTTRDKVGSKQAWTFLKRRVLRIFPLYWFWTSVLLVLWLAGFGLQIHHYTRPFILCSYLLFPSFDGANYHPLLGQGWTLTFEMYFYAVIFLAIILRIKRGRLAFVAAFFGLFALIGMSPFLSGGLRWVLTNSLVIEFIFGMLCGEIMLRVSPERSADWERPAAVLLFSLGTLALFSTLMLHVTSGLRFAYYGIPATCVVLGAVLLRSRPAPALLVYLGDASYSIYLSHSFIVLAYGLALKRSGFVRRLPPDPAIFCATLGTIALSSLTYMLLERRIIRGLSRWTRSPERKVRQIRFPSEELLPHAGGVSSVSE